MKTITADIKLTIAGTPMQVKIRVPNKKTKPDVLLPMLRNFTQLAEDLAVAREVAQGNKISCKNGCDACCHQLVPVTQLEARYLVALIERMPKARKKKYKAQFSHTYEHLQQAGIIDRLLDKGNNGNVVELALSYFKLGVPCPFLEDGSCTIYSDRPLRCREYLVTSPAGNCVNPSKENIRRVKYPIRMSRFLGELLKPWTLHSPKWVPLSIIFAWVERFPEAPIMRHSKEWIDDALTSLTKQKAADHQEPFFSLSSDDA